MKKFIISLLTILMVMTISSTALAKDIEKFNGSNSFSTNLPIVEFELKEGEVVDIPLVLNPVNKGNLIQPLVDFTGDAGVLSLSAVGNKVEYKISMSRPATSFTGTMSITNLTSGLSDGRTSVTTFSGSVPYSARYNNRYSATLTGTAFFFGDPVANVVPNYITWVSN